MFGRIAPAAAACLLAVLPLLGQARIEVPKGALEDEAALAAAMPAIAERIMAVHSPADRAEHLDVLFRLQLLRADFAEASRALAELRAIRPAAVNVRWEIYANAKSIQAAEGKTFEEAFTRSFTDRFGTLDDKAAYEVQWTLGTALQAMRNSLRAAMARHKGADSLAVADAIDLGRRFFALDAFRAMEPSLARLLDEDDRRRYVVVREMPVKTPAGATVCAMIVRPRTDRKLPTILNFTIYADPIKFDEARRTAANGYAAVIGLSRGKGPSEPSPAISKAGRKCFPTCMTPSLLEPGAVRFSSPCFLGCWLIAVRRLKPRQRRRVDQSLPASAGRRDVHLHAHHVKVAGRGLGGVVPPGASARTGASPPDRVAYRRLCCLMAPTLHAHSPTHGSGNTPRLSPASQEGAATLQRPLPSRVRH